MCIPAAAVLLWLRSAPEYITVAVLKRRKKDLRVCFLAEASLVTPLPPPEVGKFCSL